MGAKGGWVCGTWQRAVRQQGQVLGIKGSKAGGRCQCSDKSQKMERRGRQSPRDRGRDMGSQGDSMGLQMSEISKPEVAIQR